MQVIRHTPHGPLSVSVVSVEASSNIACLAVRQRYNVELCSEVPDIERGVLSCLCSLTDNDE